MASADKKKPGSGRIRMVAAQDPGQKPDIQTEKPSDHKRVRTSSAMDVNQLRTRQAAGGGSMTIYGALVLVMIIVYLVSFFGFMKYDSEFTLAYFMSHFRQNVNDFFVYATGGTANNMIHWRFFQSLIILIAGMGLAASGAVYKAIFRNTLASPDTLGVQSGGNLGNVIYVLLFSETLDTGGMYASDLTTTFVSRNTQAFFIFIACFISMILLSMVASTAGRGKMNASAIVLTGVIFSAIIASFVNLIQYQIICSDPDDPRLEIVKNMSLGTFNYASTLEQLVVMFVTSAICLAVIFVFMGRMNLYSLGEEEALASGMNVRAYKYIMVIPATMLVAIVMAYCGHIAFIAFLVPQIARKLAGTDFRRVLVVSMLVGGILMTLVYDLAVIFDMTDALNVLTTSIGGIFMMFILLGRRGSRDAVIAE